MTTFDDYSKLYQGADWKPKAQRTVMANPPEGMTVERVEFPEHFATEQDATYLYRPKGQDYRTSNMARIVLPYVEDGAVLNHARVATTVSANKVDRERSWKQLHTMAAAGNESAVTMLKSLEGLVIEP